jgi:DNA polymerase-3 subunit delta'
MPLSEVQGQGPAVAKLRAALRGSRLHHAYLIAGSPGAGAGEIANRFAEALLCPNDPEGCGVCSACDRARRGLHPDLLRASLDREGGSREVKVEAIRDLCAGLQLKASEGGRKVGLLLDADRLSASAQNALLKTLEEPPPGTVLILACDAEERLLPTVRSRCARIGLAPLPRSQTFGAGFTERRDRLVSRAVALLQSRGRPEAALAAVELAEEFAEDRERAAESLEVLAMLLRDVVAAGGGASPETLLVPAQAAAFVALAKKVSPAEAFEALDALRAAWTSLDGNGAPRLQLEAAALHLGGWVA